MLAYARIGNFRWTKIDITCKRFPILKKFKIFEISVTAEATATVKVRSMPIKLARKKVMKFGMLLVNIIKKLHRVSIVVT